MKQVGETMIVYFGLLGLATPHPGQQRALRTSC